MRLPKEPDHDWFEHQRIAFQMLSETFGNASFLSLNRRRVPVKSQKLFEALKVTKKTLFAKVASKMHRFEGSASACFRWRSGLISRTKSGHFWDHPWPPDEKVIPEPPDAGFRWRSEVILRTNFGLLGHRPWCLKAENKFESIFWDVCSSLT